ncbi:hypothetical protein Misp01_20590 [Microtetraspora sp. NBRC 13810]|uniref:acyl carrier protein n=1 Tax=Microtetraspora sp. NBRC 13810 TaxID=3030990 RepID=UPI0024A207EE|nr:acyl carrier protein [Microtetraspora sp. NBRC 13810]GLW06929.1 hypothetical protein Misp01_20590 [Microtetraspora sp. NBRC 13810]
MTPDHAAPAVDDIEREFVSWVRDAVEDADVSGADNFLDAGGNSMTAMRLRAMLIAKHGVALDLAELFRRPMREALAGAARRLPDHTGATPDHGRTSR